MKAIYESFSRFFEQPTRDGLRELLKINFGEQDNLDFKREWPVLSKIAKHILAFSNAGGGCIVIGVSQLEDGILDAVGIDSIIDKADISKGVRPYLPDELDYNILDFSFTNSEYEKIIGRKFQVILVEDKPQYMPFISEGESEGIKRDMIYIRRGTNSEIASYDEVQKLINRRIDTGYSSTSELKLEEHLAQLKVLYENISRYKYIGGINGVLRDAFQIFDGEKIPNEIYPEENFEKFIVQMIDRKKKRIEIALDLR